MVTRKPVKRILREGILSAKLKDRCPCCGYPDKCGHDHTEHSQIANSERESLRKELTTRADLRNQWEPGDVPESK